LIGIERNLTCERNTLNWARRAKRSGNRSESSDRRAYPNGASRPPSRPALHPNHHYRQRHHRPNIPRLVDDRVQSEGNSVRVFKSLASLIPGGSMCLPVLFFTFHPWTCATITNYCMVLQYHSSTERRYGTVCTYSTRPFLSTVI